MDIAPPPPSTDGLRSVEELEGVIWTPPSLQSYVARTSFALRRKPLRDLTDEELRVGLGQQVAVEYLAPLAVQRLGHDPLVEARLYPGDLLQSLLELPSGYWRHRPDLRDEAARIARAAFEQGTGYPASWQEDVLPGLREAYARFTGKLASRVWLRPQQGKAAPP